MESKHYWRRKKAFILAENKYRRGTGKSFLTIRGIVI